MICFSEEKYYAINATTTASVTVPFLTMTWSLYSHNKFCKIHISFNRASDRSSTMLEQRIILISVRKLINKE